MRARGPFPVLCTLAAAVALAFIALPLAAVFLRVPLADLLAQLASPAVVDALLVTGKTSLIAHALVLAVGTPAAYALAARSGRLSRLALTLVELPLVLPPAVAGLALLAVFGSLGLLGGAVEALGLHIAFTQGAVVLALLLVAGPLYLRFAVAAFQAVDPTLLAAARTLGASPWRVFRRVALPLAARGLGVASTLSLARGLGEFGATIMFAGSLQGVTRTLSLAVYAEFDVDLERALAVGALLVLVSLAVLLIGKSLGGWRSPLASS